MPTRNVYCPRTSLVVSCWAVLVFTSGGICVPSLYNFLCLPPACINSWRLPPKSAHTQAHLQCELISHNLVPIKSPTMSLQYRTLPVIGVDAVGTSIVAVNSDTIVEATTPRVRSLLGRSMRLGRSPQDQLHERARAAAKDFDGCVDTGILPPDRVDTIRGKINEYVLSFAYLHSLRYHIQVRYPGTKL